MERLFLALLLLLSVANGMAAPKSKTFKIMVQPKEASIFVNNQFIGYGFAEFNRPDRKTDIVAVRNCLRTTSLCSAITAADCLRQFSFSKHSTFQ